MKISEIPNYSDAKEAWIASDVALRAMPEYRTRDRASGVLFLWRYMPLALIGGGLLVNALLDGPLFVRAIGAALGIGSFGWTYIDAIRMQRASERIAGKPCGIDG